MFGFLNDDDDIDQDIQALIDGELDEQELNRIRSQIKNDPESQKTYQKWLKQKDLLQLWWKDHQH
ncbi:MAG TPA: hypothetical protein PK690_09085 [Emcibacteraceae bacterium]|nr:hypothetical protein [Emcibacteraceae bacterium]